MVWTVSHYSQSVVFCSNLVTPEDWDFSIRDVIGHMQAPLAVHFDILTAFLCSCILVTSHDPQSLGKIDLTSATKNLYFPSRDNYRSQDIFHFWFVYVMGDIVKTNTFFKSFKYFTWLKLSSVKLPSWIPTAFGRFLFSMKSA